MNIQYKIKGVVLDVSDLMEVYDYYEAACTAEYIMDNHDVKDEEEALKLGYEVRRRMDKYEMSEDEAIDEVLADKGIV